MLNPNDHDSVFFWLVVILVLAAFAGVGICYLVFEWLGG